MADQDALIAQFVEISGATPAEARNHLQANAWDISAATTEYFTAMDEDEDSDVAASQEPYTGPRTLDGRPAPESVSAAAPSTRSAPAKQKGVATLGSIGSGGGHGHAHDDEDDSDSEDERDKPRDLFAGGEKSGLAVQDPSKKKDSKGLINDILKKARENAGKTGEEPSSSKPQTRFTGTGQTLGGDDTPSQAIPDPRARAPEPEHVTRTLHIWEEGFSIEDGELRRFDDPRHARDLQMIQQGRAPLHLMGVRPDQPVDVQLVQHNEKYKPPPKVYKPFGGSGHRLGSEVPGESSTTTSQPAPQVAPAPSSTTASRPEPEVDSSQPTVTLRLQLADGTRMPARFNTTNTIGDVYAFVERASPGVERAWVLATTFPNKDHTDRSLKLEDVPEFKRGGNAVQKWV